MNKPLPQPPITIIHEAALSPIWSIQIWNNGYAKLYHEPQRGESGQYVIYLASDGVIRFCYKWGKLHSRQIPAYIRKAAIRAYNQYVTADDQAYSRMYVTPRSSF